MLPVVVRPQKTLLFFSVVALGAFERFFFFFEKGATFRKKKRSKDAHKYGTQ